MAVSINKKSPSAYRNLLQRIDNHELSCLQEQFSSIAEFPLRVDLQGWIPVMIRRIHSDDGAEIYRRRIGKLPDTVADRAIPIRLKRAAQHEKVERFRHRDKLTAEVDWVEADAFELLRAWSDAGTQYDTIVLDPPAFAKSKRAVEGALRGYKELNLRALKMLRPGGVLITCSCSHHISAADFTAIFQTAQGYQQFAPFGKYGLAREKLAEDDSVTAQQHPADGFECFRAIVDLAGVEQRPTSRTVSWTRTASASLAGAALRINERAQIVEAVGSEQARSDKFPERCFHF